MQLTNEQFKKIVNSNYIFIDFGICSFKINKEKKIIYYHKKRYNAYTSCEKVYKKNPNTLGGFLYMLANNKIDSADNFWLVNSDNITWDEKYKGQWTAEEDEILIKYYPYEGKNSFKRLSTRSKNACAGRVNILGLTRNTTKNSWTTKERDILLENFPTLKNDICKLLPNRTYLACSTEYYKLKQQEKISINRKK